MSLKSSANFSSNDANQDYEDFLQNIRQEISDLFSQMQAGYNSATQIVNALFNMVNVITAINSQNNFALEQSFRSKKKAFDNQNCFEELQNNVTQAQVAQENSNASFSLTNAAQMQAQAAQNLASLVFSLRQRVYDMANNDSVFSSQESFSIISQADNLSSSVQAVADSAQNYYYSMQNWSEKSQEKASEIYRNVNEISNILDK